MFATASHVPAKDDHRQRAAAHRLGTFLSRTIITADADRDATSGQSPECFPARASNTKYIAEAEPDTSASTIVRNVLDGRGKDGEVAKVLLKSAGVMSSFRDDLQNGHQQQWRRVPFGGFERTFESTSITTGAASFALG